jgi:hypothetical protein
MFRAIKTPIIAAFLAGASLWSANAFAGSVTFSLVRSTLSNVDDPDGNGLWQYEGGALQSKAGTAIGTYIIQRRVTSSGTQSYNTAGYTVSLFLAPTGTNPLPSVITVEGAFSYTSGAADGSVSADSNKYHWIIGADVNATVAASTTKLVISWIGSDDLHVP